MTIDEVKKRVMEIAEAFGDPEVAHGMEDQLWHDVLRHIASGEETDPARELAAEALKTQLIDFPRWYA